MLDIRGISKTFEPGTVHEKRVLCDLSLHLERGEFATVVGSNGAGKSTLFNAICGSFFTDSGTIELDGEDVTFRPEYIRAKAIGRLFQDPLRGTAPDMTVEENLALAAGGRWLSRVSRGEKQKFRDRLAQLEMGLEDCMRRPVGLLSGGQRQALTLVMATMVTPKLLLLDEHTAALDPAAADKVLNLTEKIVREDQITCLMITHNMSQALTLGSRTLVMENGSIALDISGEERAGMTVNDLLDRFRAGTGQTLDNDRMLLA